jgi:hypothetical protein
MKTTSVAGALANCSDEIEIPSKSGSRKAGIEVLSGSMVEGVAAINPPD